MKTFFPGLLGAYIAILSGCISPPNTMPPADEISNELEAIRYAQWVLKTDWTAPLNTSNRVSNWNSPEVRKITTIDGSIHWVCRFWLNQPLMAYDKEVLVGFDARTGAICQGRSPCYYPEEAANVPSGSVSRAFAEP